AALEDQRGGRPEQHKWRQVGDGAEEEAQALGQDVADAAPVPAEVEDECEQRAKPRQAEADRITTGLVELGEPGQPKRRHLRSRCLALPLPAGGLSGGHRRVGRRYAGQSLLRRAALRPCRTSSSVNSKTGM